MTMPYCVKIGAVLNDSDQMKVANIIDETFHEVNTIYNKWNPDSELSKLNQAKAATLIPLSKKLLTLLHLSGEIVSESQGFYDPTVEPLVRLWKRHLEEGNIPSDAAIESLQKEIGWNRFKFESGQFMKESDSLEIDLSGIAKGYAVDLIVENLKKAGFHNVYVEWGGEIRASGKHPDQRPWRVYIAQFEDPDPDHALDIVDLDNSAIATSGNYLQTWQTAESGISYTHILNPKTGQMLQVTPDSICSVSVKAKTCALADGLATAAMLFNTQQEALVWVKQIQERYPDTQFWIMTRRNRS